MIFWIMYFALAFLIVLHGFLAEGIPVMCQIGDDIYHIANNIITAFGLVGVFGYAFRIRIFSPTIWKIYFPVIILWDIPCSYVLTSEFLDLSVIDYWSTFWTNFLIGLFLWIPYYVALFLYAFRFLKIVNNRKLSSNDKYTEERILENAESALDVTRPFPSQVLDDKAASL
jgi:hypothetical protein